MVSATEVKVTEAPITVWSVESLTTPLTCLKGKGCGVVPPAGTLVAGDCAKSWAIDKLKITRFRDEKALAKIDTNYFAAGETSRNEQTQPVRLRIGFVESSNVNSAREMVNMVETLRHFEAMTKWVQGRDEIAEKAIRKLGDL